MSSRAAEIAAAVAPAALLALLATWAGTLYGGAGAVETVAAHLALLVAAAAAGGAWRDPLRIGRGGVLLLLACLVSVVASLLVSPVARAGRTAILLLPTFPLLAAATARAWATPARCRLGLGAVALAVAVVAAWALGDWRATGIVEAAAPIGHHNLLAAWLVALLPLAALGWRYGGATRALAVGATALGVVALVAAHSLAGGAALAAVVVGALVSAPRRRRWTLPVTAVAVVVGLAALSPRLQRIAAGEDLSAAARAAFLRAGVAGIRERPLLGWGPGSAPWTVPRFLRPIPAVHPPGEVVADLHSLPVHLAFELGLSGLLLATGLGLVFLRRRLAELHPAQGDGADRELGRAALLGLLGLGVAALGGLPLSVLALPAAAAVLAGTALAATAASSRPQPSVGASRRRWGAVAIAALLGLLLVPADLAHLEYDRAIAVGDDAAAREAALARAVELDPAFPLYRARVAWSRDDAAAAEVAAQDADSLSALWLAAGAEALAQGDDQRALRALVVACDLDPLSGAAPFLLTLAAPDDPRRVEWAGRAILGDPRWLAAGHWLADGLAMAAALRVEHLPGVPIAWRASAVDAARRAAATAPIGDFATLAIGVDHHAAGALSLYAFRRRPWPQDLALVPLRRELLPLVTAFPGASATVGTAAEVYAMPDCGLGRELRLPASG